MDRTWLLLLSALCAGQPAGAEGVTSALVDEFYGICIASHVTTPEAASDLATEFGYTPLAQIERRLRFQKNIEGAGPVGLEIVLQINDQADATQCSLFSPAVDTSAVAAIFDGLETAERSDWADETLGPHDTLIGWNFTRADDFGFLFIRTNGDGTPPVTELRAVKAPR